MSKEQSRTMSVFLPYFWDLIIDAAEQEWDKFVEIRVSVSHMEEPITNDSSDRFSHLEQKRAKLEKAKLIAVSLKKSILGFSNPETTL